MRFSPLWHGAAGLLAGMKFLASFRVPEWRFEHYPVLARRLRTPRRLRGQKHTWSLPGWEARIVRWPVRGVGDTREAAIENLRKCYEHMRARQLDLPRPGTRLPVAYSSPFRFDKQPELAQEFIRLVLRVCPVSLTSDSSLWDFTENGSLHEYYTRIRSLYAVEASDIPGANIAEILERIAQTRPQLRKRRTHRIA